MLKYPGDSVCIACRTVCCIHSVPSPAAPPSLTPREVEVIRLLAAGESNKLIAFRAQLSPQYTSQLVSGIYRKLGIAGHGARVKISNWARDNADILPPAPKAA